MSVKARISMPEKAKKGDLLEIKTLVSHPMESGFRRNGMGETIEQNILRRFSVDYGGGTVFETEFGPGIAANPYVAFFIRAQETGVIKFLWEDQDGQVTEEQRELTVR